MYTRYITLKHAIFPTISTSPPTHPLTPHLFSLDPSLLSDIYKFIYSHYFLQRSSMATNGQDTDPQNEEDIEVSKV